MKLKTGDWVEVRSRDEILRTLDSRASLEQLPFMPEMLQFCGKRFRVQAIAHKTCDTVQNKGGRRMQRTVHLEGLRCDGSAHGNCQAACLLFWKTDWLKPADSPGPPPATGASPQSQRQVCDLEAISRQTQLGTSSSGKIVYSCQATRLLEATQPLPWWDIRQYVRDVMTRNVTLRRATRVLFLSWFRALTQLGVGYRITRPLYERVHRMITGGPAPGIPPGGVAQTTTTPTGELNLGPGEWVQVRPYSEIQKTLNRNSKNRGLWFDDEMVQHCGKRYRVQGRVKQIINEKTGEMMSMQHPCIVLDNVNCRASYTPDRLLCPRSVVTYWREIWLERVSGPAAQDRQR
jgi:hypothetical protein